MSTFYSRIKIVQPITNWLAFCLLIYVFPIMAAPFILFYNVVNFGILATIFETFWSSYAVIYQYSMPICLASAPVFIWLYSFRARIEEANGLYEITDNPRNDTSWLVHKFNNYYLLKNRDLSIAYGNYLSSIEHKDNIDFHAYLQIKNPDVLYKYTNPLPFIPEWLAVQSVGAHTRRGHTRYTKNGPIEISQHGVRAHTRVRR